MTTISSFGYKGSNFQHLRTVHFRTEPEKNVFYDKIVTGVTPKPVSILPYLIFPKHIGIEIGNFFLKLKSSFLPFYTGRLQRWTESVV